MDADSSTQRHIELQSSEDLAYLLTNVRRAAKDHLDEAFPPVEGNAGEGDDLRIQIERYVNDYINNTFTHAAPNLSINGLPADPAIFLSSDSHGDGNDPASREPQIEYEPWDAALRDRVGELAAREQKLSAQIAEMKKTVPGQVASSRARRFGDATKRDEEALRERIATDAEEVAEGSEGRRKMLDLGPLERQDGVEERHADAVSGLGRTRRVMPSTVAKMERARVAGEYYISGRSS